MPNQLMAAADRAHADGVLTAAEHATLAAFNWQGLLAALTPLLALIPGLGKVLPIVLKLLPYIAQIFSNVTPNVVPNGGDALPDPR